MKWWCLLIFSEISRVYSFLVILGEIASVIRGRQLDTIAPIRVCILVHLKHRLYLSASSA